MIIAVLYYKSSENRELPHVLGHPRKHWHPQCLRAGRKSRDAEEDIEIEREPGERVKRQDLQISLVDEDDQYKVCIVLVSTWNNKA